MRNWIGLLYTIPDLFSLQISAHNTVNSGPIPDDGRRLLISTLQETSQENVSFPPQIPSLRTESDPAD